MKKRTQKLHLHRETLHAIQAQDLDAAGAIALSGLQCNSILNTCVQITCGVCACGPSCHTPCASSPCAEV